MIVTMTRVRLAGPTARLEQVLAFVQDLGVLHVVRPAVPESVPVHDRAPRHCQRMLADVDAALSLLSVSTLPVPADLKPLDDLPRSARLARRVRRQAA